MKLPARAGLALLILTCLAGASPALSQDPKGWAGTWKGTLQVAPGEKAVAVTMELGPFPTTDQASGALKRTYEAPGKPTLVKDYRLVRGRVPGEFQLDEGDGTLLTARWIGDRLVIPYRYKVGDKYLLMVSTMRLRDDLLEDEILTLQDVPPAGEVQSLVPLGLQRMTLRRVKAAPTKP